MKSAEQSAVRRIRWATVVVGSFVFGMLRVPLNIFG
jgi:hypothetical protein